MDGSQVATAAVDPPSAAADLQRAVNRAEAERSRLVYDVVSQRVQRGLVQDADLGRSGDVRVLHERAAVMELALQMNLSEAMVRDIYHQADIAQELLPATWMVFQQGLIGAYQTSRIASYATNLRESEHICTLDGRAAAYAVGHRPAQLNAWLRRTVAKLEPEAFAERAARNVTDRRVWVQHIDDGVSLVSAVLPTLTAEAIARQLRAGAQSPDHPVPRGHGTTDPTIGAPGLGTAETRGDGDERTLAQREADLFAHLLLQPAEPGSPDHVDESLPRKGRDIGVNAHIAVMITSEALLGTSEEPAVSRNRQVPVPAAAVRSLVSTELQQARSQAMEDGQSKTWKRKPSTDRIRWHQMHLGPPRDDSKLNILTHRYTGRFVPSILREAICFRDGTCQAPGCTVAAENCDVDHIVAWDPDPRLGGPTEASNLQNLCRKHHGLKTTGLWSGSGMVTA